MLLNKYKYSLNRGLHIRTELNKKGAQVISFALISQQSPALYSVSTDGKDTFMLYNDNEYLHRKCCHVTGSPLELIQQLKLHPFEKNNLTLFIANQPKISQQVLLGLQQGEVSIIDLAFKNILERKEKSSSVVMSVVGVCNENMLTDELQFNQFERSNNTQQIRQILRLKNTDHSFNKYQLEGITKISVQNQQQLIQQLKIYKQIKSQKEYLSISQEKYWDWLQAELFILQELTPVNKFREKAVLRSHYILKVNQYLQNGSSLMLNLGILLRKMQQNDQRGTQSNDSKLFKLLSNCWNGSNFPKVHLFLQIGHSLSLKEEYLALVPTSQISNTVNSGSNVQQLPFCYIKGYQNYPKITSFVSKLNKNNIKIEKEPSQRKSIQKKGKVKPYARDTLSSIQKRRVNSIQMEFEQTQSDHNKNVDSIIQEVANLYRQADPVNFRLSYHKKSNEMMLKRHKKVVERFSTVERLPSEFYRSEKMRQKDVNRQSLHTKTPISLIKSEQKDTYNFKLSTPQSTFQIYAKGKRLKNYRKCHSRKEKLNEIDFVDEMLKKQMLVLQKGDLLIFQDGHKVY